MNRNRKLSEKTYGPRRVQPHQPRAYATKKKKLMHPTDKYGLKRF